MTEPVQAPVQQAQAPAPTGQAASAAPATAPVQQAQTTPATEPSPADPSWQRYQGLQSVHQQTVAELRNLQTQFAQTQQHAGTLETQLSTLMQERQALQNAQQALNAQLAQAQQEQQFFNLVTREFPQLVGVAPFIQRAGDEAEQRQILQNMAQAMGQQATQQARQQVAQNLAGATPGATPVAGGNPMTPSYEEVMAHVMDPELARRNPDEFARWWAIYENHPQMNYRSLGRGEHVDPYESDINAMRRAQGVQPAPLNAQTDPQTFDRGSPGMPGAWGSPTPPVPGGGNNTT